jgi:hypothetical protein
MLSHPTASSEKVKKANSHPKTREMERIALYALSVVTLKCDFDQ